MIVAGFGFRAAATLASLENALAQTGVAQALATPVDKASHPAFAALAAKLNLPVIAVNPEVLPQEDTATRSKTSIKHRNSGSVCEASALAAAGPGASLIKTRALPQDRLATCALAQSASTGPLT